MKIKNSVLFLTVFALTFLLSCNPHQKNVVLNKQNASLSITIDSLIMKDIVPGIVVENDTIIPDNTWEITQQGDSIFTFEKAHQWRITQIYSYASENPEWFQISTEIENLSSKLVPVDYVIPLMSNNISYKIPFERYLSEAQLTWNYTGLWCKPVQRESYSFAGFSDPEGEAAMVIGFDDMSDAVYTLDVDMGEKKINSITAKCHREGVNIPPNEKLRISDLVIKPAKSLTETLKEYGWIVAENMGRSEADVVHGWCSWYYYYGTLNYQDLLSNMNAIQEYGLADKVEVIQIDAGWYNQTKEKELENWMVRGDWLNDYGFKFPMGMERVAEKIKEEGFMPGIWTAPFLADPESNVFKEHSEYFVFRDKKQILGFDLSHPEALNYVERTFDKLANQDGYEYFKIDFLGAGLFRGSKYNEDQTTVESFRDGMNLIRKTIGDDSYLLACGAPLAHCIGIVDGARVGHDIATHWVLEEQPELINGFGGHGVQMASNQVILRQWMNRIFWHNDPDVVITRDYKIDRRGEKPAMAEKDAELWARLTWFVGGMGLYSENIPELAERSPERFELMAEAVPPNEVSPDLVDWYKIPKVSILKSDGDPVMFGLFNLGEEPAKIEIPAGKLGLTDKWKFKEKFNNKKFEGSGEIVKFPELPAHGSAIWVLDL